MTVGSNIISPQPGPQTQFLQSSADVVFYGGCVSGDTEFLTTGGWKMISEYSQDDLVAQWKDGVMFFVKPKRYINTPSNELIHFHNKRVSMKLSGDHRMLLYDHSGKLVVKRAYEVARKPSSHKLPVNFTPSFKNRSFNESKLRLTVAIHADGELIERKIKGGCFCRITLRKERKKERLKWLLSSLGLEWKEYNNPKRPTEIRYSFFTDISTKNYSTFWALPLAQLEVIIEEMSHWDGCISGVHGGDISFSTTIKGDADFIQYAAHCCGRVANISTYKKPKINHLDCYKVHVSHKNSVKSSVVLRGDCIKIDTVQADRQYCFETDSGFWIARHDGKIFVTGNSAGGGKTFALLLDPLYNIDNSQFGSVIFRRTTKQITKQGSLWDTANELYLPIGARPLQSPHYHFIFDSGAKINLHHMEHEKDRFDWQGSQVPDIKFDEITHFTWAQFNYMFSRLRSMSGIPGRIRATCNPDPDHWLRSFIDWWIGEDGLAIPERSGVIRYVVMLGDDIIWGDNPELLKEKHPNSIPKSCTFIRSSIEDNKILLDRDPAYMSNLHALTRVEKARLLLGNWNVRATAGSYFKRGEFETVDTAPAEAKRVRAWDLAATKRKETSKQKERKSNDPDWTAGCLMSVHNGIYYIEHMERFREDAPKVEMLVKNVAIQDGLGVKVRIPQDPGQAGKAQAKSYIQALAGHTVVTYTVTGDKEHRATPLASQVQAGNVRIVKGKWNEAFLTELENFPDGIHDDQVDSAADAFDELTNKQRRAGAW